MTEYIEREKALDFISEVEPIICMPPNNKPTFTAVKDPDMVAYLESIPAADVRPVVRGKWTGNARHQSCSECHMTYCVPDGQDGEIDMTPYHFCPNCGARMEES